MLTLVYRIREAKDEDNTKLHAYGTCVLYSLNHVSQVRNIVNLRMHVVCDIALPWVFPRVSKALAIYCNLSENCPGRTVVAIRHHL